MTRTADELYALALEADRQLLGSEQGVWLERLDQEREALQAFLERLIEAEETERALQLAGALARFWWMRGHAATGRELLERVLQLSGGSDTARASALVGAGSLAYAVGDFRGARVWYESAIPLLRQAGAECDLAHALDRSGMAARQLMELEDAWTLHAEALALLPANRPAERALCLNNLGVVACFRGELENARTYHQQALVLRQQAGDLRGQASSLNNLGLVEKFSGDLATARDWMEQGLELRRQLVDHWGVAGSQVNLAAVQAGLGELAAARQHLREAVAGFRAVSDPLGACECLESGAELAHAEGRHVDAVELLAAATCRRESLPAPRSPLLERFLGELLEDCRSHLRAETAQDAWQRGSTLADTILDRLA